MVRLDVKLNSPSLSFILFVSLAIALLSLTLVVLPSVVSLPLNIICPKALFSHRIRYDPLASHVKSNVLFGHWGGGVFNSKFTSKAVTIEYKMQENV